MLVRVALFALCGVFAGGSVYALRSAIAAETPKADSPKSEPPKAEAGAAGIKDAVAGTPKGKLANPYKDTQADMVEQGGKLFLSYGCSGCHGGGAGGGMCPPLTNDVWVYGGDDDTLFRLVTLGSDELQKAGYTRIGRENVVGPMPPFGDIVKSSEDLWKLLVFARSKYRGDPAYKFGPPPDPQ